MKMVIENAWDNPYEPGTYEFEAWENEWIRNKSKEEEE